MTRPGQHVADFERAFAEYVGARYCIAAANGTVTLQAALVALGIKPGDRVAVPPLTMAATSIAVLNVGAVPVFVDVHPDRWTMDFGKAGDVDLLMPVSLYGLTPFAQQNVYGQVIDDAAQRLSEAWCGGGFTSYSLQASKILQTGEGGMLVTDGEALAEAARSYLSLGYAMGGKARIDKAAIKSPDAVRHVRWPAINGRLNDATAALGLERLAYADRLRAERAEAASFYADAVAGCRWLAPQHVPDGWRHDWWAYAVACDTPERAVWLQDEMAKEGAEMPYGCWRITYQEPAFRHLAVDGTCPVAESLQPRIAAFQTNDLRSADRNAAALRRILDRVGRD